MIEGLLPKRENQKNQDGSKILVLGFFILCTVLMITFVLPDYLFSWRYVFVHEKAGDIANYYYCGLMIADNNPHIYVEEEFRNYFRNFGSIADGHRNAITYPPLIYVIFSFLARWSLSQVNRFWFFANHLFLIVTIWILYLIIKLNTGGNVSRPRFLLYFAFALFFSPVVHNNLQGQVNTLMMMLLALAIYWDLTDRPFLCGLFIALAVSIKITPGILIFYFLARRKFKPVLYFIMSFLLIHLFVVIYLGLAVIPEYISNNITTYTSFFVNIDKLSSQTVHSFARRLFSRTPLNPPLMDAPHMVRLFLAFLMTSNLAVLLYTLVMSFKFKTKESRDHGWLATFHLSFLPVAVFLFLQLVWDYHQVFFIITLVVFLEYFFSQESPDITSYSLVLILVSAIALIGTFNGFISPASRPIAGYMRLWFMTFLIPQVCILIIWWIQGGLMHRFMRQVLKKDIAEGVA